MIRNTIQVSLAVLLGAILLLAVSAGFSATQAEESNAVVIKNFMFSPMALTIKTRTLWSTMPGCSAPPRSIRTTPTSSSSINPGCIRSFAASTPT
jgi:hypothetical protein